jgi:hypothetical protein
MLNEQTIVVSTLSKRKKEQMTLIQIEKNNQRLVLQ